MTGCEFSMQEGDTFFDMRASCVLGARYVENMRQVGLEIHARPECRGMYSTDVGNVSYKLPAVTGSVAISNEPIPGHWQQMVDAAGSDFGYDQLIKVSKAMALTAFDLLTDADMLAAAKEEHKGWYARDSHALG